MKSVTKKIVFYLSLLGSLPIVAIFVLELSSLCNRGTSCFNFSDFIEPVVFIFIAPITALPFSLITFWMKEEVFQAWFRFARWYVPFMVIGYFIYPGGGSHSFGAGGAMADSFNAMVYIIVISIFVIVSIKRIVRGYKKTKVVTV